MVGPIQPDKSNIHQPQIKMTSDQMASDFKDCDAFAQIDAYMRNDLIKALENGGTPPPLPEDVIQAAMGILNKYKSLPFVKAGADAMNACTTPDDAAGMLLNLNLVLAVSRTAISYDSIEQAALRNGGDLNYYLTHNVDKEIIDCDYSVLFALSSNKFPLTERQQNLFEFIQSDITMLLKGILADSKQFGKASSDIQTDCDSLLDLIKNSSDKFFDPNQDKFSQFYNGLISLSEHLSGGS